MDAVTVGCFDLLHRGHLNLLTRMRQVGETTVILHDDRSIRANKGRAPAEPLPVRIANLQACGLADHIRVTYRSDPSIDIERVVCRGEWTFMRGDDWPQFPGRETVEAWGVPIVLVPYTPGVSTTLLRKAM